ncbi:MAG TPA: carboxymuconolactone decarboxylase family protein, partial [Dehalococcoidia bacterium]|nr:carboxymuconolactone decarboxylase family protein [Dehalococcoidia bacterium]
MARVKLIQDKQDIAAEHHGVFDELAALRGRVSGPSTVMLYSPGLARPWNQISEYLHGRSVVEPENAELAVCATARECACGYIWAAHLPLALKAGVPEASIDAVRHRRALDGLPAQEALVVRYVRQLLQGNRVENEVFEPLLKSHGARWLLDLTVWIGRYAALAGIINSFEVSPAPDADVLPVTTGSPAASPPASVRAPLPEPRIVPITSREQMGEADRGVFDAVAEGRGNVRGPFSLLMYSPPLCQAILDVSNYLRFESDLSPRLRELATIATAREKDCPYVWAAHAPAARREGIADASIFAVRDRSELAALAVDERDIVHYARQLLRTHRVSQALFDRLRDAHGVRWLVELT